MQEFLPNTYRPARRIRARPVPPGFVYLTSNGHSTRHTGQIQLRRRLRNGLTATVQYTLSKAMDDAGAFTGVSMNGSAIAQDWQHLDAEWAPSNFDQRHLLTAQVQYTTGVGVTGGGLMDGAVAKFLQGLDDHQPADGRQRPAADAGLSDVGRRHRRHRHDPRERHAARSTGARRTATT